MNKDRQITCMPSQSELAICLPEAD